MRKPVARRCKCGVAAARRVRNIVSQCERCAPRLLNRLAGTLPRSSAAICASLAPVLRAIATCWIHAYRPSQRWDTRRITSSRSLGSSSVSVSSARTSLRTGAPTAGAWANMEKAFVGCVSSGKPLRRTNSVNCRGVAYASRAIIYELLGAALNGCQKLLSKCSSGLFRAH